MKADQRVGLKVGKLVVDLADLMVDTKVDWMAVK